VGSKLSLESVLCELNCPLEGCGVSGQWATNGSSNTLWVVDVRCIGYSCCCCNAVRMSDELFAVFNAWLNIKFQILGSLIAKEMSW
jgi:hypothetical protein